MTYGEPDYENWTPWLPLPWYNDSLNAHLASRRWGFSASSVLTEYLRTQAIRCLECAPKVRRINTCSVHGGAKVPVILCRSSRRGVCAACLAEGREGGWCHTPPTPALGTVRPTVTSTGPWPR